MLCEQCSEQRQFGSSARVKAKTQRLAVAASEKLNFPSNFPIQVRHGAMGCFMVVSWPILDSTCTPPTFLASSLALESPESHREVPRSPRVPRKHGPHGPGDWIGFQQISLK